MVILYSLLGVICVAAYVWIAHYISYTYLKNRVLKSRSWDLNICSGKTDGGGVNADIYKHMDLPNFKLIEDIYNLPFHGNQFETVLCSHTIEHVDDPKKFFEELRRVGGEVTIVVPPLYDVGAVLDILEHKWIFLTFKTCHTKLPAHIKLPLADTAQRLFGQINRA